MAGVPIMRVAKHKAGDSVGGVMRHHMRTQPTSNADPQRLHLNEILIGPPTPKGITKAVKERIQDLPKKKNANVAVEIFLGASDEFWAGGGDWRELAGVYEKWMIDTFGEDNIIGFGAHLDENQKHFWAIVTPVTPDGRLASSHWFDGPAKLSRLQADLGAACAPLGMDPPRKGSKASHIDMATMQQAQQGNTRAQKVITNELAKREKDALARAEKATQSARAAVALEVATKPRLELAKAQIRKAADELDAERAALKVERAAVDADKVEVKKAWSALEIQRKVFAAFKAAIADVLKTLPMLESKRVKAAMRAVEDIENGGTGGYNAGGSKTAPGLPARPS